MDGLESCRRKKIDDQAKILAHLRDLTFRGDRELKAAHLTVQTEMKNYSSNVAESCSAALAPKKIEAAVRILPDEDDHSKKLSFMG